MSLVASSTVLVLIVCLASVASIHQSFDEEWELFKVWLCSNMNIKVTNKYAQFCRVLTLRTIQRQKMSCA